MTLGHHRGSTVSIPKLRVGPSFCVGVALCGRPPPGQPHRVAPTAAPALSGYERVQVGVFLLPPLMHQFSIDTVVACAMRTERGGRKGRRAHTEPLIRLPGTAAGARYSGVYQCHAFWFSGSTPERRAVGVS